MTSEIPKKILDEYNETKKEFPKCWIGYNAELDEFCVYLIPISWTNSLLIEYVSPFQISYN
jgi:hypothetical protein